MKEQLIERMLQIKLPYMNKLTYAVCKKQIEELYNLCSMLMDFQEEFIQCVNRKNTNQVCDVLAKVVVNYTRACTFLSNILEKINTGFFLT